MRLSLLNSLKLSINPAFCVVVQNIKSIHNYAKIVRIALNLSEISSGGYFFYKGEVLTFFT